jgi:hypothetical protein
LEARLGSGQPAAPAGSPEEWVAGVFTRMAGAQAMGAGGLTQAPGGMSDLQVSSNLWCKSRFVCATMQCGGSSWC